MIELFSLIPSWIIVVLFAVTTIVGRAGASKIFFDVVGTFQSRRLIQDAGAAFTTFQALAMDAFSGIEEAAMMFNEQMQEIVDETVPLSREIAAARIEFDKFISVANRADLGGQVREIGVQFGYTGDQALRAGAKMAQLSTLLGEDSVPAATEMSLAFGMIGEMDAEQAMQRMINLHQQTGFMLRGTTEAQFDNMDAEEKARQIRIGTIATLNELNAVEDHSAANMERITFVMNQFAAQAHLTGESLAEMAAMSAVLIEAGEEQGKAGRALRMIYARLGADTSGAATELEKLGVATQTAEGDLRPLSDILVDLEVAMEGKSEADKRNIAQVVAGNNHYIRMLKLMEGTERMTTLVRHASDNASPVIDILNERFQDTSVQLTQVETDLHNTKAAIGDELLPVTLAATRAQLGWNQAYEQLLSGNLGPLVKGVFSMQQTLSMTVGPSFQMFLNIKQMNLALMTAVQVSRSLRGVTLAGLGDQTQINNKYREQELLINKLKGNTRERVLSQTNFNTLIEEETNRQRNLTILKEYEGQLGMSKYMTDLRTLNIAKQMVIDKKSELAVSQANLAIYNARNAFTLKERIALYALGQQKKLDAKITQMGLTRELNSEQIITMEKKMQEKVRKREDLLRKRAGMLSIAEEQAAKEILQKNQFIVNNLAHQVLLKQKLVDAGFDQIKAEKMIQNLIKQQAMESQKFAFEKQMRLSNAFMMIQVGAMAATGAITLLGDKMPFVEDAAEAGKVAMVMMGLSMAFLIPELMMTSGLMGGLSTNNTGVGITAMFAALTNFELAAAFNAAAAAAGRLMVVTVVGAALMLLSIGIVKALDYLGVFDNMMSNTMESVESMFDLGEDAFDLMLSDIQDATTGVFNYGESFKEAGEKMQQFGSDREELFFGFKAGNVTGDLVKQIKQQGVENFIANTEIIMTNNFNGMTTKQAAQQIVEEIESAAGTQLGSSVGFAR